ncbi:selenium-binding protein 1-like isoform X2 [Varroa jacobsoni]|nr:selenium-binding protein 1-like isoform X2 [Varroa destructor]XP_022656897.1 selenium-binding protein 1-like isoform X2 [Varroa destructor]XP_022656899.1 selenium-binding protein 1-like isoform X2 [Varroa destructor]XP_022698781.1 selenium-binding protein 1-like isoform X2 [Varroa jacobsoni]
MKGPREKIMYVPCIVPKKDRPDYLAVIDIDPESNNYLKVIHRSSVPYLGDEVHHMNWNTCSSCYNDSSKQRDKLILPCLLSNRIYTFDLSKDPLAPLLFAVVEPSEMAALGVSSPHTPHCLPGGDILISTMGDKERNGQGSFVLLDGKTFKPKRTPGPGAEQAGLWGNKKTPFGYDYWYQPRHNVMVSSEWGAPRVFENGFNPAHLVVSDVKDEKYGRRLHFWNYSTGEHQQSLDLGEEGFMPLETRFLHNPDKAEGYVGCAITSTVFHFCCKKESMETWTATKVISIPHVKVNGWCLPEMPAVITDILISLDDRFLYISCWLIGEVRQYNIEDPANPKLVGLCQLGGCIRANVTCEDGFQPSQPRFVGKELRGGPQMLQLSLDGKRLYLTTSLFSRWDAQFYPEMIENGSMMVRLLVDTDHGGLRVDEDFLVDFGDEPEGPVLAHELRYFGGDCSSDIWL